jgi:hypothetical protein
MLVDPVVTGLIAAVIKKHAPEITLQQLVAIHEDVVKILAAVEVR